MPSVKPQIDRARVFSRVSILLLQLVASGCSVSFSDPDPDAPLGPDDRGRPVGVSGVSPGAMAWNSSSQELYAQGENRLNLVAIDVVSGTARVVDEAPRGTSTLYVGFGQIVASPGGAQLYYSLEAISLVKSLYVRDLAGGQ